MKPIPETITALLLHHKADEMTLTTHDALLADTQRDGSLRVVPICFPEYEKQALPGSFVPKQLHRFRLNESPRFHRFYQEGIPVVSDLDCLIWDYVLFGGEKTDRIILCEGDMLLRCGLREFFEPSFIHELSGSEPRLGWQALRDWFWYPQVAENIRHLLGENVASVTPVCGIQMTWKLAETMARMVLRSNQLFDNMHVEMAIATLARLAGVDVAATVVPEGFKAADFIDFSPERIKFGPWGIFHPVKKPWEHEPCEHTAKP